MTRADAKKMLGLKIANTTIYVDLPCGFVISEMGIMNSGRAPKPEVYESLAKEKVVNLKDLGGAMLAKRYLVSISKEAAKLFMKDYQKGDTVELDGNTYTKDTCKALASATIIRRVFDDRMHGII